MKTKDIEVHVHSWKELKDYLQSMVHDSWYFRGQGNTAWNLTSSLERTQMLHRERELMREFKRGATPYIPLERVPSSTLEWMAMMQHYGTPTRLLDMTKSPYVSTFFAMSESFPGTEFRAMWAINFREILREIATAHAGNPKFGPLKSADFEKTLILDNEDFKKIYLSRYFDPDDLTPPLILPIMPYSKNERLTIQQGLFLCPTRIMDGTSFMNLEPLSLEDNLINTFEGHLTKKAVIKFVIPSKLRGEILTDLDYMNINDATLFPGLDGFSRSLAKKLTISHWKFDAH